MDPVSNYLSSVPKEWTAAPHFEKLAEAQPRARVFDLYIFKMFGNHWLCSIKGWEGNKLFFGTLVLHHANIDSWAGDVRLSFQPIAGEVDKYYVTNLDKGETVEAWFYPPKIPEWHDGPHDYE